MEPLTVALISTVTFGVVTALSVFLRQILLSRDKRLNDKAHKRAIAQEASSLEKIRQEMQSNKRLDSHYQVLGDNRDAIQYLDQKIETLLEKKFELIERYAKISIKESTDMVKGEASEDHKLVCDMLREEIDKEMVFYEKELRELQERRSSLWDSHSDLQDYLLDQEKTRDQNLSDVYRRHSEMLEKIYQRHHTSTESVTLKTIEAGSESFNILTSPFKFIMKIFGLSTGVDQSKIFEEIVSRKKVLNLETEINGDQDGFNMQKNSQNTQKAPQSEFSM